MAATKPPLTTAQVARRHRVSARTIARMVLAGELPYITKFPTKTGGYLFELEVVDRVFAARSSAEDVTQPA